MDQSRLPRPDTTTLPNVCRADGVSRNALGQPRIITQNIDPISAPNLGQLRRHVAGIFAHLFATPGARRGGNVSRLPVHLSEGRDSLRWLAKRGAHASEPHQLRQQRDRPPTTSPTGGDTTPRKPVGAHSMGTIGEACLDLHFRPPGRRRLKKTPVKTSVGTRSFQQRNS